MLNKRFQFLVVFFFAGFLVQAQDCEINIKGNVFDQATGLPLSYVNVFVQEIASGTTTNDDGKFELENICTGEYHFIFSHIGCEAVKFHIDIFNDTILNIPLSHNETSLGAVVVEGKKETFSNQPNTSIGRRQIEDNSNKTISDLLENETGVHLLKNGSGIAKPIVHGLFGNRLTLLNNGIIQSGQQWGNDHSPEIDPFSADKITILKGASAIEYGGGNLGSVILVEPKRIEREPHLHGQVNYTFDTNGQGNILNTRLEKYSPILSWKVNGSLKKYGDRKTPDYFLNNTGVEEANFSVQLEKSFNDKLLIDFYASSFNTTLGILRGSHIDNRNNLQLAFDRSTPFFTEPNFSYAIEAPMQKVSHHLAKIKAKYFFKEHQELELVLAGQLNDRKEFDIRRNGRTEIPSLNLKQYSFNSDIKYANNFHNGWKLKIGNQNILTDNTNTPGSGILPLIPDYISWKTGLFSTLSKSVRSLQFNVGLRYDYELQNVAAISRGLIKEIIRYENNFHNLSALFAMKYDLSKTQSLSLNTGYAVRNPGINELYSNGLHQGVSGIEEGDVNLKPENAVKNTLEYAWLPNTTFTFKALAYHQHFRDYIYLNPQDEIRPTIRGAFPVFKYKQTDANIYGLDLSTQFTIRNLFFAQLKYSYLRGQDTDNDIPLIFMPPNRIFGSLTYRSNKSIKFGKSIKLEETEIEINNRQVFEQKNILVEQDFAPPPKGYNLLGAKISTNAIFKTYKLRFFAKAENIFNVQYRDYLNRHRYFADDQGFSLILGINFKF